MVVQWKVQEIKGGVLKAWWLRFCFQILKHLGQFLPCYVFRVGKAIPMLYVSVTYCYSDFPHGTLRRRHWRPVVTYHRRMFLDPSSPGPTRNRILVAITADLMNVTNAADQNAELTCQLIGWGGSNTPTTKVQGWLQRCWRWDKQGTNNTSTAQNPNRRIIPVFASSLSMHLQAQMSIEHLNK